MNRFLKSAKYFVFFMLIAGITSCFKDKFPVVSLPDDVAGDSITSPLRYEQVQRKVLVIGIGGCRGEAMRSADMPVIRQLFPHAVYSFDALTQSPALDAPGFSSMFSGVWSDKHGVIDNDFAGSNFSGYPVILKYINEINPRLRTVSVCSWNAVNEKLLTGADVKINTNEDDAAAKDSAVARLKNDHPDVMFVNFEDADHAGETFGYDASVSQYMAAISRVDGYIGEILTALDQREQQANEDWLVIISTDHGGDLNGYGGDTYADKNIFTLFYNKAFQSKELVPPANTLKAASLLGLNQYGQAKVADANTTFLNFDHYQGFTVQFQVQSSGLTGDNPLLTNKNWNSGKNPGWVIAVQGRSWKFNVGDGSDRIDINANAPDLGDNKWHGITVTVDKAGDIKLYQDGVLYNNSSAVGRISTWISGSNVRLATGDDITGDYRDNWGISPFSIANIKVWNTVIEEEDLGRYAVACDTTISSDNPYYSNLLAWWKGTDGSGGRFKDSGPDAVDLTLSGNPSWTEQQLDFCNDPLPPSVPTIVDIAPSIFSWLRITTDPGWGLDGRSWLPKL